MKFKQRFAITMGLFIVAALIVSNIKLVSHANSAEDEHVYLPVIKKDPTPTPTNTPTPTPTPTNTPEPTPPAVDPNLIKNGSFEEGWSDLPPAPGYIINQQPNHWQLTWVDIGEPIFGTGDIAYGIPECIHKLDYQLPPHERPGGSDPLILDGTTTYKVFHYAASFGVELEQVVTGLTPGEAYRLTVPIRIHINGSDTDPWGAETGAWVDSTGGWTNQAVMGDRTWYTHVVDFTAPASGQATVMIRMKNKYAVGKDFFMDAIQLQAVSQ